MRVLFADIHTHILFGTDDGPEDENGMYEMADRGYAEGIRILCATPHFHPEYFGDNRKHSEYAFQKLKEYCEKKYPDLVLVFGNELFYRHDCISWLKNKIVNTYGDTRYVLLEFSEGDSENFIAEAVDRLLSVGYIPIIAHAERYFKLSVGRILALKENGALIQANAQSMFMRFQFRLKCRMKSLLAEKVVDFISTDAHNLTTRPLELKKCYALISSKYGKKYADNIFYNNAKNLFCDNEGEQK